MTKRKHPLTKAERLLNERKKKREAADEVERLSRIRRRSLREQAKVQEIQDELQGYQAGYASVDGNFVA